MVCIAKYFTEITPFLCYILLSFCVSMMEGVKNVRLVGSKIPLEGRVEVFYKGEWGTVCVKGWKSTTNNLDVVCRELGFSKGRAVTTRYPGPGTGTTWLDDVTCTGNEKSIIDCPHKSWGDTSCPHSQDVSVQCDVCNRPILSNKNLVQDWSFSATAYREINPPQNARFTSAGSWCLSEQRNMEFAHYLEVELPRLYFVSTVATLGGVTAVHYVTLYSIVYSIDGKEWNPAYVDGKQIIPGNSASGNDNVETRNLDENIRARFMRFTPKTWGRMACMRVEICGRQLPHAPTVLVREKQSSVILSWSNPDPGDDAIIKYYVRHWEEKEGRSSHKMFESTSTSAVIISHLSPFTAYQLEISGVSNLGEGLPKLQGFQTLESVPSGSPTRIKSSLVGTTAINISWAPPDEDKRNGRITSYIICFPKLRNLGFSNSASSCKDQTLVPGSRPWYIRRDVDLSVEQKFEIRARTAEGSGPTGHGTTRVLGYSPPEGVASSLIIAVTFGALLLSIIIIVVLAAKGIVLKNFVRALRKLTSSQITLSSQNSKDGHAYIDPEGPPQDDLYIPPSPADHVEVVHEACDSIRRMTLVLVEEGDIYGRNGGFENDEPLYESHNHIVGTLHEHELQQNHELRDEGIHEMPYYEGNTTRDLQSGDQQNEPQDNLLDSPRDQNGDSVDMRFLAGEIHFEEHTVDENDFNQPRDQHVDPVSISQSPHDEHEFGIDMHDPRDLGAHSGNTRDQDEKFENDIYDPRDEVDKSEVDVVYNARDVEDSISVSFHVARDDDDDDQGFQLEDNDMYDPSDSKSNSDTTFRDQDHVIEDSTLYEPRDQDHVQGDEQDYEEYGFEEVALYDSRDQDNEDSDTYEPRDPEDDEEEDEEEEDEQLEKELGST